MEESTRINLTVEGSLSMKLQCIKDREGIKQTSQVIRHLIADKFNGYPEEARKGYE